MEKIILAIKTICLTLIPVLKNPDSLKPIKDFKEAVIAALEIGLMAFRLFKDGVQFSDFTEFYNAMVNNEEFKAKVKAGYENYQAIPEQLKDADAGEVLEVVAGVVDYIPRFMNEAKKEKSQE